MTEGTRLHVVRNEVFRKVTPCRWVIIPRIFERDVVRYAKGLRFCLFVYLLIRSVTHVTLDTSLTDYNL